MRPYLTYIFRYIYPSDSMSWTVEDISTVISQIHCIDARSESEISTHDHNTNSLNTIELEGHTFNTHYTNFLNTKHTIHSKHSTVTKRTSIF